MPPTSTPQPVDGGDPGWSAVAFDLTAIALGLAWLVGTGWVALLGVGERVTFFGETVTAEDIAESRRLLRLATVVALTTPLAGLALSAWLRRKRFGILFAVLLLLGVAFAGLVEVADPGERLPQPVDRGPRACQESSGGDNRCPGG